MTEGSGRCSPPTTLRVNLTGYVLSAGLEEIRRPKRWFAGMGFLPVGLRAPLMNRFMSTFQRHDVLQDLVICEKKRFIPRPRLCRSDGEIMRYRRYCAQFYPDPGDSLSPVSIKQEIRWDERWSRLQVAALPGRSRMEGQVMSNLLDRLRRLVTGYP